jgi:tetratricopeptide (TPR) repeat protein
VGLGGIGSLPWWIRRSGRPIAAGALLFLIPLLPVLGLITFDFQWYSNVADHYLYLPMLGAAMIAAWICRRWNRWPVYAAAAVILASLGIASNLRAAAWEDTDTLFGQDLKVNPTSALALNQFMLIAYQQNKEPLAMALAKKEIARHPDDVYAHRMMGLCYRAEPGKQAEAIEAFRKALALSPDDSLTLEDFAGVLAEAGRFAEAEKLARRSIVVDPDSADAYGNLGYILLQERKRSQAIDELRVASHLNANSTRNHDLLGQAFEESGKRQAAIEQYKAALRIDPQSAPALAGLRRLIGNDVNTQQSP